MKYLSWIGMLFLLTQTITGQYQWTPERLVAIKDITDVQVSPDGQQVLYVVKRAVMNNSANYFHRSIFKQSLHHKKSQEPQEIIASGTLPRWSPDGNWMAYLADDKGKKQLWAYSLQTRKQKRITNANTAILDFKWASNGLKIVYRAVLPPTKAYRERVGKKNDYRVGSEQKRIHLWEVNLSKTMDPLSSRQLTSGTMSVGARGTDSYDISPDGKTVAFSYMPNAKYTNWIHGKLGLAHLENGHIDSLNALPPGAKMNPVFSPDGTQLAFLCNPDPKQWVPNRNTYLLHLKSGHVERLSDTPDKFQKLLGWDAAGSNLIFTERQGTIDRLGCLPTDGQAIKKYSGPKQMVTRASLNYSNTVVGFVSEYFDTPAEASYLNLEDWLPVTISNSTKFPKNTYGRSKLITWPAVDGTPIEGILTLPPNHTPEKKVPLITIVHGGPAGRTFCSEFDGDYLYFPIAPFTERGYAVFRPNPRGSTGYGTAFSKALRNDFGGIDYSDVQSGIDFLIATGVVDGNKLGIMGGSYGGYLTAWNITQTHRFKAAVEVAGFQNLISFANLTDMPDYIRGYFDGEPMAIASTLFEKSPIAHVAKIQTPLLILQGTDDKRVPKAHSEEFYEALVRAGVKSEMISYPRERHGIYNQPKFIVDAMQRTIKWMETHINR